MVSILLDICFPSGALAYPAGSCCTLGGGLPQCPNQSNNPNCPILAGGDCCPDGYTASTDQNTCPTAAGHVTLTNFVCTPNPTPIQTCAGATGGYCSSGDFCTRADYTYASSTYECAYSCCRPLVCSDLADTRSFCPGGFTCPSGYTISYADSAASNSCSDVCCSQEQQCNGGTVAGACLRNPAPANSCGYFGGSQSLTYTTYVHPLCGQGNTSGNGYTCTPSTACYQTSAGSASCTPSPAFTYNCATNFVCTNSSVCTTTITAHVFVDYGHDGTQNGGDTNAVGVAVSDGGGNTFPTDGSGNVAFTAKTTGTYTFSMTVPANFAQTTTNPLTFTVGAGDGNKVVSFGITPLYAIGGTVFLDNNHDQKYELGAGDQGYSSGGTITVSGGPTSVNPIAVGGDGTWATPTTLLAGTYTVTFSSTLSQGYTFMTPSTWTVTVGNPTGSPACATGGSPDAVCGGTNGGSISNLNFGINPPYQIAGQIFSDVNKPTFRSLTSQFCRVSRSALPAT